MIMAFYTSFYNSNLEAGLAHGEKALAHYRQVGNRWGEAEMLYEMGLLLASYRRGNERVMIYLQEALRIRQQLHDREGEAETLTILGKPLHGATNVQHIANNIPNRSPNNFTITLTNRSPNNVSNNIPNHIPNTLTIPLTNSDTNSITNTTAHCDTG